MEKVIICVHGRGQDWEIKNTLERNWCEAILFGLERVGIDPIASSNIQIRLAHYGDLFRPDAYEATKGIHLPEEEVFVQEDSLFEEELAESILKEAQNRDLIDDLSALEPSSGELNSTIQKGPVGELKRFLRNLDHLPGFSDRILSLFVRDVTKYLNHPSFRQDVLDRVVSTLQQYPDKEIILVAHSLGSVIAYDLINTHPEFIISTFLTLGSPLGISCIYRKLLPEAPQQRFFPQAITIEWRNFYDIDDLVALIHDLAPLFQRTGKPAIISTQVFNGGTNHHAAKDYLSSKAVGLTIRAALALGSAI